MDTSSHVNFVDHSSLEMYPQSIYNLNLPNESSTSCEPGIYLDCLKHWCGDGSRRANRQREPVVFVQYCGGTVPVVVCRECGPIISDWWPPWRQVTAQLGNSVAVQ